MGAKKKSNKPVVKEEALVSAPVEDEKKNVNLLRVYTIYKQKFRRLTREEFDQLLGLGKNGKIVASRICKELMKAKNVPEDVRFEKNVGFLSLPRFLPMVALLAERSEYNIRPCLVRKVICADVPKRFKEKFSQLLVYGFWFLGRVICDSISVKEQVNRGNIFNFAKGDLGYWWAGVKIMDWNCYVHKEKEKHTCAHFIAMDPPKYRFYSSRAIHNMGQHPLYFLTEDDWTNFYETVRLVRHKKVRSHYCCSSPTSTTDDFSNGWGSILSSYSMDDLTSCSFDSIESLN